MNNNDDENPNPIPPPQHNVLPLPNRNQNPRTRGIEETNRIFERAEKIMKALQTPQTINALKPFDGNPAKLHMFIRSVEHFLPVIEPMKDTPFEKIWLQAIRAKIINEADQVLETYGTSLDWDEISLPL